LCVAEIFDVQLEGGNAFGGDAKDFKEIDPKGLGLAVFVAGVGPSLVESNALDFISFQLRPI
jgi:hypothetical protein